MRIADVMRAPVSGLLRHVVDLIRRQARGGHSARRHTLVWRREESATLILMGRSSSPPPGAMSEFVHASTPGRMAAGALRSCRDSLRATSSTNYLTSAQLRTGE